METIIPKSSPTMAKSGKPKLSTPFKRISLYVILALAMACPLVLRATPYASCMTYDGSSSNVTFYVNEAGGNVTVTYEDGTTNGFFNGVTTGLSVSKGKYTFNMTNHTGYAVSVTKIGNGVPFTLSLDNAAGADNATNYTYYSSGRAVAVNKNPKIGSLFGRVYVDNSAVAPSGTPARGMWVLNSDFSPLITNLVAATGSGIFAGSGSSGPYRMRVAPDNTVYVGDFSTADAALWQFSPDLTTSNLVLGPVGENQGIAARAHGDMFGTAHISGSLATSNLVVWVADSGMPVPTPTQDPALVYGPGTSPGMYNNIYRYDIGAGPLPWTNSPNYAFNLGLDVIPELVVEVDVAPDGKIFPAFGRSNLSNPDVLVLDPTGLNILWTSWIDTGGITDPWRGDIVGSTVQYPYGGVRVSPDDAYFASVGIQDDILIAKLTNGIPDDNTLFAINDASGGNSRGMDWDLADNIYKISSGQAELRAFSLGASATCVTSNDITGTNGTFVVITPPLSATALATTPTASQGYGTPTAGVITITLNTNTLTVPSTVGFTKSGTATYTNNYTLNVGTNGDGVIITPTNVIFPAGAWTHGGNWSVDIKITPTPVPLSGPTLTAIFQVLGGANNLAGTPGKATVSIINTGPQLLILSVLPSGTTMSRGVTNDYVLFQITRLGDTSVAGYTITNINYQGTATYPGDYTAQAQRFSGSLLSDGSPGIFINSGEVFITNGIGNPVQRANLNVPPVGVTIILSMTNAVTGTNVTSSEGFAYVVSATNAITLTEVDNTVGSKVLFWSDALTDAADSVNWRLTYASENLGTNTVMPVVIPNYVNGTNSVYAGGTNDFDVEFGYPLPDGIPPSPAMLANGWTNVLKMTVNKNQGTPAGVNVYPQGIKFQGNYALRFSMYLSIWDNAIDNVFAGAIPREYAIFGVNHSGTNCNWRPSRNAPTGSSGTTNADGIWFALDAADNAATPADFDAFTSPGLPNAGVNADLVSNAGSAERGIFKNPPFINTENPAGGEPVDQWVDVSVEITAQTNCTLYVNGAPVLTPFSTGFANATFVTNAIYTNGTVMLGYLDPDASVGDPGTEFVYYSNIRALELSPYITAQPVSLIVTQGANVSFTSAGGYASAPITNVWAISSTNSPKVLLTLQTNSAAATNIASTLSLTSVQTGTNYSVVYSDTAGSVTSTVASLEVITGPTNQSVFAGSNLVQIALIPSGAAAPTGIRWKTNGVPLVNGSHFAGVTNAILNISNVGMADAVTYTAFVTNSAGSLTVSATLSVVDPQPLFSSLAVVGTNAILAFASSNAYDSTNSFILQESVNVAGPYVAVPGIVTTNAGGFQYSVPLTTNSTMFYRLSHN
ncbi:MAG TPA: hypothetical protein VK815_15945 [Candidatus Acidoferrales bacterium]|jgi:hypothetical protein|nr:hypothetical protein [Candidatus Acidoferrales bacterium]